MTGPFFKQLARPFPIHCTIALTWIAFLSVGAHGSPLTFTYDWSASLPSISGNNGLNAIDFSSSGPLSGTQGMNPATASSLSVQNGTSDTFTARAFNLEVKITDGSNSGTVAFSGQLNGSVVNGAPTSLAATVLNPMTQTLKLGTDTFTMSLGGSAPQNGMPWSGKLTGVILADPVSDVPPPGPLNTPEPSTLMLAATAAACLGTAAWRRARG